jgi:acyl carrier protein
LQPNVERDQFIKSVINSYISKNVVTNQEVLPLKDDSKLIESRIFDSLSLMKLALFLEEQFGITVEADDLVPENFETVERIATFIQSKNPTVKKEV